ncbi:hypothetical protein [Planctomyces sp. SH-PL14]|uniref:hypothetical protein n=1 Tax=Planctomyces sp. SH-PL14 TaxID=1632864 RepID=UPI00078C4392|nr:hypothetical protein [Planctomyces sp. SH-PL14]AMV16609.1 hypothetical protein VT03_01885 [Planctomyces sp. SH-PL14]
MEFLSQIDLPSGLPIVEGGTGATTAAGARDNLGLGNAALANASPFMCGRLTLESGVAVSLTDQSAKSTLYLTADGGNVVSIHNGSLWVPYSFSQPSLTLSGLTSGKNYDVFTYASGGSPVIDLGQDWTNDTTRATAVSLLNGIYVNTSSFTTKIGGVTVAANQGTLLGTIRATSSTTTTDTLTQRFVSNLHRPALRWLSRADFANSHTMSSTTVRGWNNASAATLEWVTCIARHAPLLWMNGAFVSSNAGTQGARLGFGTATTAHAMWLDLNGPYISGLATPLTPVPATGYNIYYVTESATGSGNSTFYYYTFGGLVML